MKKLAEKYNKNGYQFELVERTGDVAIYSQHLENRIVAYEVFEVQKYQERIIAGKIIPASEATPSNEQWGIKGYTYWNLDRAKEKACQMHASVQAQYWRNVTA